MSWWLRLPARPWETARALASRVIPLRLRWRLMRALGRDRGPDHVQLGDLVRQWQSELQTVARAPQAPALLLLGALRDEGRLSELRSLGWRVVDSDVACGHGADIGRACTAVAELRRRERIHEAVVVGVDTGSMAVAEAVHQEWGWPIAEGPFGADSAAQTEHALRRLFPLVSILIVTHNNAAMTRLCLDSLRVLTTYPNRELIVVDNASTDETREVLEDARRDEARLRVLANGENRGFAAACNQAALHARGEILCFLNNDTVLNPGWLWTLVRALREPAVGMVGPVSNAIGNEARVRTSYETLDEMLRWASASVWRHDGARFRLRMLALFCAAMRREVWDEIGGLDEGFGLGMFEDDDYCRRLRRAGYRLECRRDSFVHHWQQASFRLLDPKGYLELYERNRAYYREKWSR